MERTQSIDTYHERQWAEPYRSTVAFADWLAHCGIPDAPGTVIDAACGRGAATAYLAQCWPTNRLLGFDHNRHHIVAAVDHTRGRPNVDFVTADLYRPPVSSPVGIVCLQTLSWLPHYDTAVAGLLDLRPRWFACSSLFYDGPVECITRLIDQGTPTFCNIYSLPAFRAYLEAHGARTVLATPFQIDIDLAPPANGGCGTYTLTLQDRRRLQFTGPIHLPWWFVLARF